MSKVKCFECGNEISESGIFGGLETSYICSCGYEGYANEEDLEENNCILCGDTFVAGETGNELGFCCKCTGKKTFKYDLDAYYKAYDEGKEVFKGFETMSRGILEKYLKARV